MFDKVKDEVTGLINDGKAVVSAVNRLQEATERLVAQGPVIEQTVADLSRSVDRWQLSDRMRDHDDE